MIQATPFRTAVIVIGTVCAAICTFGSSPVCGQQYRGVANDSIQLSRPIHKFETLKQRLKQAFSSPSSPHDVDYRVDRNLRQPIGQHPRYRENNLQQATRIGVVDRRSGLTQTGYQQQPEIDHKTLNHQPVGDRNQPNAPQAQRNPYRQHSQPAFGPERSQGSMSRNSAQSPRVQENYHQTPDTNNSYSQNPGTQNSRFDVAGPGSDSRFQHFSRRKPASEIVILLEDQLDNVTQEYRSLYAENQTLQRKLNENERLLAEIQTSIDEAIQQLTAAQSTNQGLQEKIVQLETEKIEQEKRSSKLFDDIRGQLNDLLAAEISDGG